MNCLQKLFKAIKKFLCPESEECQCCQCQRNCEDMDVDMANRIIQEMWDKEERYYKSLNK